MHERDEAKAESAIAALDAIVSRVVGENNGHVILEKGEGDSHFCAFANPVDAVRAVIGLQVELADRTWEPEAQLKVRAAIHRGEAELKGSSYQGKAVIRCARLRSCAHGGQILITQAVMREVCPEFADQIVPLGRHWLRDLKDPEDVFQVNVDTKHVAFPPLRSVATSPNNLPTLYSSFVGREGEMEALSRALLSRQLVTVTGPGGTGKTRLALEVAGKMRPSFPSGVWFVPMADYSSRLEIVHGISKAIGVPLDPEAPERSLFEWLKEREALLVLDNAEHMMDDVGRFVDSLLKACESPSVLCTSRQPLGLNGEQEFNVRPLSVPPSQLSNLQASHYEAYALLVERALDRDPTLTIDDEESAAFCRIARLLDGLPLAIELAVPRLRSCSPQELANRLERSLSGLASQPRNEDVRHRTIRNAIDWSFRLLSEPERRLLTRLSCFVGGWSMEAAKAVAGVDMDQCEFQDAFDGLVEKSLAYAEYGDGGERRFRLLELIRQFSHEKLSASGEAEHCAARHSEHYRQEAEHWYEHTLKHESDFAIREFETDRENAHQGLRWSIEHNARPLEYVLPLTRLWLLSGRYREGEKFTGECLTADSSSSLETRARVLQRLGSICWHQGKSEEAEAHYAAALGNFRELGNAMDVAAAICNLGMIDSSRGQLDIAVKRMKLAYRLVKNQDQGRAWTFRYNLNGLLLEQGRYDEAVQICRQMVEEFDALGQPEQALDALTTQAWVTRALGRADDALSLVAKCLERIENHPNSSAYANLALTLAECAMELDREATALECLRILESYVDESGYRFTGIDQQRYQSLLEKSHLRIPDALSHPLSDESNVASTLQEQLRVLTSPGTVA